MDTTAAVGAVAKWLFPKGLEFGAGVITKATVAELSRAALPRRRPLFEAGFITVCASIKSVLPALTGKGYAGMEIADGTSASQECLRIAFEGATAAEKRAAGSNSSCMPPMRVARGPRRRFRL